MKDRPEKFKTCRDHRRLHNLIPRLQPILTVPRLPPDIDAPPALPERPTMDDCCQGGCNRCVFDIYEDSMERYREALRVWQERRNDRSTAADRAPSDPTRA
ncbi:MAG: oxidoreductase-like domain-containing protein [Betaproteobacteria bacterium]